jgi:hypothetical protein
MSYNNPMEKDNVIYKFEECMIDDIAVTTVHIVSGSLVRRPRRGLRNMGGFKSGECNSYNPGNLEDHYNKSLGPLGEVKDDKWVWYADDDDVLAL